MSRRASHFHDRPLEGPVWQRGVPTHAAGGIRGEPIRNRAYLNGGQSAGDRANAGMQRRTITVDFPPMGTQGRAMVLSCSVPKDQTATVTHDHFEKGLLALHTQMSQELAEEAFAVMKGVQTITTKHGDIIQAQLVVSPEASAAFSSAVSIQDTLNLPHPFSAPVSARWADERKMAIRIINIPASSIQPGTMQSLLEGKGIKVHSCNWDKNPESGLPRAEAMLAIIQTESPPGSIRTSSGHVMPCHVFDQTRPHIAPKFIGREEQVSRFQAVTLGRQIPELTESQAPSYAAAAAALGPAPGRTFLSILQSSVEQQQQRAHNSNSPPPPSRPPQRELTATPEQNAQGDAVEGTETVTEESAAERAVAAEAGAVAAETRAHMARRLVDDRAEIEILAATTVTAVAATEVEPAEVAAAGVATGDEAGNMVESEFMAVESSAQALDVELAEAGADILGAATEDGGEAEVATMAVTGGPRPVRESHRLKEKQLSQGAKRLTDRPSNIRRRPSGASPPNAENPQQ